MNTKDFNHKDTRIMNTDLIKIDAVKNIASSIPEAISLNDISISNCNNAGKALLDTIEAEGMSDELDNKIYEYLKRVNVTAKNMNNRRIPITQTFDSIRSVFTSQEKEIDPRNTNSIPYKLVKHRNKYATAKYEKEQEEKRKAMVMAEKQKEKATYKEQVKNSLLSHFNSFLSSRIQELQALFSSLNLENYNTQCSAITVFNISYNKTHFDKFSPQVIRTNYISEEDKNDLVREVVSGAYDSLNDICMSRLNEIKQELMDKLPSVRRQLEELEEIRKRNAAEAERLELERKKKEQEEAAEKIRKANEEAERLKNQNNLQAQQEVMEGLFEASASSIISVTNAKVKKKIEVLNASGYLEVFQMWWLEEGQTLKETEMEKIFKKMVTYCEKQANSKEKYINSGNVRYVDEVKAK